MIQNADDVIRVLVRISRDLRMKAERKELNFMPGLRKSTAHLHHFLHIFSPALLALTA